MKAEHNSGQINVAFSHIPSKGWSAGEYYLKNIFIALKSLAEHDRPVITLLVQGGDYHSLLPFVDCVLARPAFKPDSFGFRQLSRVAGYLGFNIKRKNQISSFLRKSGVNALFTIGELGANFSLPLLSWIPDFQHLHFPDFFSEEENSRRNRTFARSARHAKRIIVSSKSCYEDLRFFAPWALDKARVLPFVVQIPDELYDNPPKSICSKYNLPERYIFVPNQFWQHKNHKIVVEALGKALSRCPRLTIVCTGNTNEERELGYFSHLLGMISMADVREQMVLLGLVPRDDLFSLMRQSIAVLQPSLFEGWSTTVEEVKSLGKPLIVSDIPVHREQNAPSAHYFDPLDADSLADCLVRNFLNLRPGPDMKMEELARASLRNRTCAFGRKFVEIVKEVM